MFSLFYLHFLYNIFRSDHVRVSVKYSFKVLAGMEGGLLNFPFKYSP